LKLECVAQEGKRDSKGAILANKGKGKIVVSYGTGKKNKLYRMQRSAGNRSGTRKQTHHDIGTKLTEKKKGTVIREQRVSQVRSVET